jgi:hypothetical protein
MDGYLFSIGFDPDEKGTILSVNHDFGNSADLCRLFYVVFCNDGYSIY